MASRASSIRPREVCEACGFDSDLYDRADTVSSQRVVARVLAAAVEGLDPQVMQRRPDESTWSIGEYIDHVREMAFGNRFVIEAALGEPGIDLGDPPANDLSPAAKHVDVENMLERVTSEYEALGSVLAGLDDEQWDTPVRLEGKDLTIGWFARHVVHDGLHHLCDIGRIRHGFGLGAAAEAGVVTRVNVSAGGVPKHAVESAHVSAAGLAGDTQNDRRHHGRPVQAVCLWSDDVIEALQQEGHPIAAGNAGENITVSGLTWAQLRPGSRIDIGSVPMFITAHAVPCAKNAQWFSDRDFNRILHDRNPGFSRLYAVPLAPGSVTMGDTVIVEPQQAATRSK